MLCSKLSDVCDLLNIQYNEIILIVQVKSFIYLLTGYPVRTEKY